jgi:iron complex transport system substrate-binding protein
MKGKCRICGPFARIILVIAIIAVCGISIIPATAITATDDAGTVITLNTTPVRIVSLAPSNTEILAALGLLDRVVAVTDVCNYPTEVANITRIGGYSAISIENVAASRPDLVIASDITPQETTKRLRELGMTVVVVSPRNIGDMIRDLHMVGTLTGTESRAGVLADNLSARLALVASAAPASQRPTIAHVVWNSPLYVSGNDTLQNDVIEYAGGTNVFSDKSGWGTVSLEEFLIRNPDIIIVSGGGGMDNESRDVILEDFMTSPQYASLSAVKNHRVYAVDADVISRAGPRIIDAVELVAAIIRTVNNEHISSQVGSGPVIASSTPTPSASGFCAGTCIVLAGLVVIIRQGRS